MRGGAVFGECIESAAPVPMICVLCNHFYIRKRIVM